MYHSSRISDPPLYAHHNTMTMIKEIVLCFMCIYSILGNLWQLSLDCVLQCLMEVQLKKGSNSAQLHDRSFTLLNALKNFYHCEGDGLKEAALKSDTYNVSVMHSLVCAILCIYIHHQIVLAWYYAYMYIYMHV